ncbi:MAG: hypothetical protein ACE149_09195 [Armatimonadota bacterium]
MVTRLLALAAVLLTWRVAPALAWGPAGHAAIMGGVAQAQGIGAVTRYLGLQATYGAIAPDLAWQASGSLEVTLGAATHDDPGCLEPWERAGSQTERAFAWGWLSHNQAWGADYFAHLGDPFAGSWPAPGPGYVVERAQVLAASTGISEVAAHDYIEVATDLLLDQQYPDLNLPGVLRSAASQRSSQVPALLVRSYADLPGANRLVIRTFESTFRTGAIAYAEALALPTWQDDASFAAGLAVYHGLSPEQSAACLSVAKELCLAPEADYRVAIQATIALVAAGPWP